MIITFNKIAQRHDMTSRWNHDFQNQCLIKFPMIYKMFKSVNIGIITLTPPCSAQVIL
jgi:hypothetical protein